MTDWKQAYEDLLARHQEAVEKARAEGRAHQAQLMNAGRVLTCVYCGHAYPPGTPAHSTELLTQHVMTCERHPLSSVIRERDEAKRDLNVILGLFAVMDWSCDCGADATCFGGYDHHEDPGFHCDACCQHTQERGRCIRIPKLVDVDPELVVPGLEWHCSSCEATEPVQKPHAGATDEECYREGDSEPCIDCGDGTCVVRRVASSGEAH